MDNKRLLKELSFEEAQALLKNNKWLQDTIYMYAMDCISIDINDVASYLDKVKYIRYEIGNTYGDYIRVSTEYYKEFLEVAQELDKDFYIYCNDVTYSRIDRIIAKCDFYYDCISGYEDISDSQFEKLEKWIKSGIEEAKKAILNYIDSLTDYDQDYYLEAWLDCYGDTYATDNKFIYELTVKKYV